MDDGLLTIQVDLTTSHIKPSKYDSTSRTKISNSLNKVGTEPVHQNKQERIKVIKIPLKRDVSGHER